MPVKLESKLPAPNEARIEIIPLIDIMFFLLAAFMLVSLSMVNLKSVKVNLPTATTATLETKNDFVSLSVDRSGAAYFDKQPKMQMELNDARGQLQAAEREARQLSVQRDELKSSAANWASAVAGREERLKEANARIRQLAEELNASIHKFNDLATNHNAIVKQLNELRAKLASPQPASK